MVFLDLLIISNFFGDVQSRLGGFMRCSVGKHLVRLVRLVEFRGPRYFSVDLSDMKHPFVFNLFDIFERVGDTAPEASNTKSDRVEAERFCLS